MQRGEGARLSWVLGGPNYLEGPNFFFFLGGDGG